jgi:hypothetical protein
MPRSSRASFWSVDCGWTVDRVGHLSNERHPCPRQFRAATAREPRPERTKNPEVHRASARTPPHQLDNHPKRPHAQRAVAPARTSRTWSASLHPPCCAASRRSGLRTPNGAYEPTLSRSAATRTSCEGCGHLPVDVTRTRSPPRMSTLAMDTPPARPGGRHCSTRALRAPRSRANGPRRPRCRIPNETRRSAQPSSGSHREVQLSASLPRNCARPIRCDVVGEIRFGV